MTAGEGAILSRMGEIRGQLSRLDDASAHLHGAAAQLNDVEASAGSVATAVDAVLAGSGRSVDAQVKERLQAAAADSRKVYGQIGEAEQMTRRAHGQLEAEYAHLERELEALRDEEMRRASR